MIILYRLYTMPFVPSYSNGSVSGSVLVNSNLETIDLPDILEQQVNLLENIENELEAVNLTLDDVDTNLVGIRQTVEAIEEEVGDVNINLVNIEEETVEVKQELQTINQKIDHIDDRLYNSTKLIPDWFDLNRLISITGISTPTDVGSMVGGWAGNHIAFNNIPLFSQDNFEVISNNANDTSGGTGCRGVFVYGLNSDLEPITETVVLDGTSAVALTKQFNHINLLTPTAFGSGGTVAGEVVIRRVSPVVQYGSLGSNQHSTGWFKCPAGFKAILKGVNYTSNSSSSIMSLVLVRQLATTSYTIIGRYDCGQSLEITYPVWTLNPGESLYMYQANSHVSKGVMTFELVPI